MKRSVGLLFFALTFVVFLLSCGISVTEGARLLKQNYDDEDAGDEIEMNAMQRKTTKNEEDDDQAAIYAAKLEEEEIENTQLSNEEESELEQVEEEVAKEASEMSSSSSSSSSKLPHRATAAKTLKAWNSRNQTIQTAGDFPRRKCWKKIEGWRRRFGKASSDNPKGKRRI